MLSDRSSGLCFRGEYPLVAWSDDDDPVCLGDLRTLEWNEIANRLRQSVKSFG